MNRRQAWVITTIAAFLASDFGLSYFGILGDGGSSIGMSMALAYAYFAMPDRSAS